MKFKMLNYLVNFLPPNASAIQINWDYISSCSYSFAAFVLSGESHQHNFNTSSQHHTDALSVDKVILI